MNACIGQPEPACDLSYKQCSLRRLLLLLATYLRPHAGPVRLALLARTIRRLAAPEVICGMTRQQSRLFAQESPYVGQQTAPWRPQHRASLQSPGAPALGHLPGARYTGCQTLTHFAIGFIVPPTSRRGRGRHGGMAFATAGLSSSKAKGDFYARPSTGI